MFKKKTLHILLSLLLLIAFLFTLGLQNANASEGANTEANTGQKIYTVSAEEAAEAAAAKESRELAHKVTTGVASGATVLAGVGSVLAGVSTLGVGLGIAATVFLATAVISWFTRDSGTFVEIMQAFSTYEDGCWFCPTFRALFNATNIFAETIASQLRDDFTMLLGLGLAFYILYKVGQSFLSFGAINPKEFIKEMFFPVFKVMIIVLLLSDVGMKTVYRYGINPLTQLSVGFGIDIEKSAASAGLSSFEYIKDGQTTPGCGFDISYTEEDKIGFSQGVIESIQCFLKTAAAALLFYMAIGASFLVDCWSSGAWHVFPNISMFFVGGIVFIMVFILFISFPFKLLDSMIRLMFFSALLPLWLVLWVFPATRDKTAAAFKMFFQVLIAFICLSIILVMVLIILQVALNFPTEEEFADFLTHLKRGRTEEAFEMMDWSTQRFFLFVAMMFLANSLVKAAEGFANQFGGAIGGIGAGDSLLAKGMMAAQLTAGLTKTPIQKAATGTGKLIGKAVKHDVDAVKEGIKKTPYAAGYAVGATTKAARKFFNPTGQTMKNAAKDIASSVAKTASLQNAALSVAAAGGAQKMVSSVARESLLGGGTKDRNQFKFTTADDQKLQENTHETNRDKNGNVTSTMSRREKFDPETGNSFGSLSIERDKVSGTKTATFMDADGKTRWKKEVFGDSSLKTDYNDKGQETMTTMEDFKTKQITTEQQEYASDGARTGFTSERKDKNGNILEHFKVDLTTNKKTDLLTGTISDYIKPKA